jgi:hypothetical protein
MSKNFIKTVWDENECREAYRKNGSNLGAEGPDLHNTMVSASD